MWPNARRAPSVAEGTGTEVCTSPGCGQMAASTGGKPFSDTHACVASKRRVGITSERQYTADRG